MDLIEKEVNRFFLMLVADSQILARAQNTLSDKLNSFKTEKNKLYFLTLLRKVLYDKKTAHEKVCQKLNCQETERFATSIFIVDEHLEELNKYYTPEIKSADIFTNQDRANLHNKLDEILRKFEKIDFGHQIIYDEIEELRSEFDVLKQNFSLGKKSWFQLAFIKFAGIASVYGIEETIVKGMYSELTREVEEMTNYLLNQ